MLKKCKRLSIVPSIDTSFSNSRPHYWFTSVLTGLLMLSVSGCERLPSPTIPASSADTGESSVINSDKVVSAALPPATQLLDCNDLKEGEVLTVRGHTALAPQCYLIGKGVRFVLDSSNTSLDCNGAKLGSNEATASKSAITIRPKADKAIENIAVANCHVQGYGHALHIRQKTNPNSRYAKGRTNPEVNRALAPHDIRVINVTSNGSKNSGIFVGDHVHHVSFDQVQVVRSGTVGLYLEFGSQHNTIQNSVFVDNGFRIFKPNREAIALDSSAFNIIKNNEFVHNGAGSILLYRNCFEHANDASRSNHFKRTESASDNIIIGNTFREEPVGVWVASRQSRNLKGFECGAYPLATTAFASYHIDSAKNNRIKGNTFIDIGNGIIVEDDGTEISGNDFRKVGGLAIKVGSKIREKYADGKAGARSDIQAGIKETIIRDNTFASDKPMPRQILISKPSEPGTTLQSNQW